MNLQSFLGPSLSEERFAHTDHGAGVLTHRAVLLWVLRCSFFVLRVLGAIHGARFETEVAETTQEVTSETERVATLTANP